MNPALAKIPEWHDVDQALFAREIASQHRPAVLRGFVGDWPAVKEARKSPRAFCQYLCSLDNGTPVTAVMVPPGRDRRVFYNDDLQNFNFLRNKLPISAVIEQVLRYSAFAEPPSVAVQSTVIADCLPGFLAAHPLPISAPCSPRHFKASISA